MQIFILQTVGGFSSTGETGGGAFHAIGLAKEWTAAGHEVHFVTNMGDRGDEQYNGGYSLHRIASLKLLGQPSSFQFLLEMLLNHLVQWKSLKSLVASRLTALSIVLALSPYPSDTMAAFRLGRAFGLPAVVYFHHLNPPPWWHPWRRGNLLRLTMNWLLTLFALLLVKLGGLLPAIDQPKEMDRARWKFKEVMADPAFLEPEDGVAASGMTPFYAACFVGRVAPSKGVLDLLYIWKKVIQRVPSAKLVIAGKCYSERFQRRIMHVIRQLSLQDSVEFRGFIPPQEKKKLLAQSQLFVFPSYEEGWSLGVMEAAYHGVIPVVYDLPAYEYLDGDIVKAPVGNISAMSDLVVDLLYDPGRVTSIAARLRSRVEQYGRSLIAQYEANYLERFARSLRASMS